jgi:MFS family permease
VIAWECRPQAAPVGRETPGAAISLRGGTMKPESPTAWPVWVRLPSERTCFGGTGQRAGWWSGARQGDSAAGGPLGLQGADVATLSATTNDLRRAFGIDNTAIGLLVSVTALAAALGTIPVGVLTDRTRRTRLLATSVGLWAVAMLFAGAAMSFGWLLAARAALGVVTATTGPTIASLTGDFFPARSRARMLGYILGGELVGTGVGFVISGEIAALVNWRLAFWWLVIPTAALV